MRDVREYFPEVTQTNEGWKAKCPMCDDTKTAFNWNEEKKVGCCFHSGCRWYYQIGGVTERRLLAYFSVAVGTPVIPTVVHEINPEVGLPEEFQLIKDLRSSLSSTLYAYMDSRGIPKKIVDKARLGYCDSGRHWGYFIFPVFDEDGEVVYWQGRRFKERTPKFINPASSRKTELIYRINPSPRPVVVILLESILNVLTLNNVGIGKTVPVALLGKTVSDIQVEKVLSMERHLKEIVVALDPDAKREAIDIAERFSFLSEIPKKAVQIRVAVFPEGQDVNSLGREKAWKCIRDSSLFQRDKRMKAVVAGEKGKDWYFR